MNFDPRDYAPSFLVPVDVRPGNLAIILLTSSLENFGIFKLLNVRVLGLKK